jgi:hypothetical protein
MKTIITALTALLLPFLVSAQPTVPTVPVTPPTPSFAQAAARMTLPIKNLGVLKAEARKQVKWGGIDLRASSILPEGVSHIETRVDPNGNADSVLHALRSTVISFSFALVEETISASGQLRDIGGYDLFHASRPMANLGIVDNRFFWFQDNFLSFTLVQNPPIFIPGLESARVVVRDKRGNAVVDEHLPVADSRMFYSTNLVERSGELYLTFRERDGSTSTQVFDLTEGTVKPTLSVRGQMGMGLEGVYHFGINPSSLRASGVDLRSTLLDFEVQVPPGESTRPILVGGTSIGGEATIGVLFRMRDANTAWYHYPFGDNPSPRLFLANGSWEAVYVMTPRDLDGVPIFQDEGTIVVIPPVSEP